MPVLPDNQSQKSQVGKRIQPSSRNRHTHHRCDMAHLKRPEILFHFSILCQYVLTNAPIWSQFTVLPADTKWAYAKVVVDELNTAAIILAWSLLFAPVFVEFCTPFALNFPQVYMSLHFLWVLWRVLGIDLGNLYYYIVYYYYFVLLSRLIVSKLIIQLKV